MTAIRVRDVSESGAAIETALRLRVGDTGVLHLDQISGQPSVAVVVKSIVPASNRVGLAFVEKGRATARVAAAARAAASPFVGLTGPAPRGRLGGVGRKPFAVVACARRSPGSRAEGRPRRRATPRSTA